ncbi:tetratricopeptide repeat-containing hybrid sensor histidine kinase/response regulator [Alteromonas stellipolaris]|uniref:tetratricopeptide repeat-containing hybrid sensor histidine kinase/response regulator n=1 Tax=Alteromonas stellipolaris TaxID=233316 RepID=UPI00356585B7
MRLLRLLWVVLLALPSFFVYSQDATVDIDKVLQAADKNVFVNPTLAKKLLTQAERYLADKDLPAYEAHLLNLKSHSYILEGNYKLAYEKATQAKKLATETGNQLQLAEALRRQGIITYFFDLYGESLELLLNSLSIHQSLDTTYIQNTLQAIGNLYAKSNQWADNLINTGEQLVAESIKRGNTYYEEQGYGFIISGLLAKGKVTQAKSLIDRVNTNPDEFAPILNFYLAKTHLQLGNYEEALAVTEDIVKHAVAGKHRQRELSGLTLQSEVLLKLERIDEATQTVLRFLSIAQDLDITEYQYEGLKMQANIALLQGQYRDAYQFLLQHSELKQQVFDTRQSEQLAFNRARLETDQKIQKITELELSQQLSEQNSTFQVYIIVTICCVAILLFFMFVITLKQKRELRELALNLQKATDAKSEFLARMSHEIRTPVNAIVGLTKLTQKSVVNEEQKTNLNQIEQSSQTLLGVINDVLDFSKIEAGKLDIESEAFELDKLVEQVIRLHGLNAREKRIELLQYVARDVPLQVSGDALRIEQVLNNLLSNAIKFTDEGMVFVSVNKKYSEHGVLLEFSVKDTGIGLSTNQIESLFDAFTQADESITRKYGGTGLGLSICKHLVSLMGGEIWVESKLGQGATFLFTVLVEQHNQMPQPTTLGNLTLSDLKVLVVDDVMLSRQAIAEALLRININPDLATGGKEALMHLRTAMASNAPYDLIIIDWKMADIDGIELASIINQEFSQGKPNIAMLSAYDIESLKTLGRPVGVEYYLQKPVNSSSLQNCLLRMSTRGKPQMAALESDANVPPDFSKKNILLVEDDAINRKVAKLFLADTKAKVSVAENGLIALQMLEQENVFDLVLMDMQMPVMDGLTAAQKIREELKLDVPIVAMTAHAMQTEIEKSFAVGMNAHIVKPVKPEYLYQVLQEQFVKTP